MRRGTWLAVWIASTIGLSGQQEPFPPQDPAYSQGPYSQVPYSQAPYSQGPYSQSPNQTDPNQPLAQDEPGQPVARLSVISGEVSVRRGDSGDWLAAVLNAPLMVEDSISVAPGGQAELQLDYANFVRIAADSEIRISDLSTGRNQIQVARGLVTYRALRDSNVQAEISTPVVAVHPMRLATVRVEVGPDGGTRIVVRRGDAEISTPRGTERVHEGNMMIVRGTPDNPEYQLSSAPPRDGWDNWNDQRDSYLGRAQSNRYVSPDIYGVEDLDANGRWGYDPAYGNVWTPNVPATWAPYRDGQWVWEDFYGWTWIPYEPWGWAPFHYGSWYYRTGFGWSWFPGQRYGHYWWHPAMVGFFGFGGGSGFAVGFGNVGWVPLAPFEVFHPWYGRGWFGGRNVIVNNVNIVHNTNITNFYRNARVMNGVTAVTAQDFQRGSFRNRMVVNQAQLREASLVRGVAPMTPTANNLRFSERNAPVVGPRADIGNQRFFSRMTPNGAAGGLAQRTPFAQQQAAVRSAFEGGPRQGFAGGNGFRGGVAPGQSPAAPGPAAGGSGWRRFGAPGSTVNPTPRSPSAGAWDRFGSPRPGGPQSFGNPEQAPRRFTAPESNRPNYGGAPNYGGPNFGGSSGPSRQLRVAPPIIQQREAPGRNNAPAFNNPPAPRGGGGGGGFNPGYRGGGGGGGFNPGYRGGGGGGRPAGGGGGGHPSGGGGNGHGGGGRR